MIVAIPIYPILGDNHSQQSQQSGMTRSSDLVQEVYFGASLLSVSHRFPQGSLLCFWGSSAHGLPGARPWDWYIWFLLGLLLASGIIPIPTKIICTNPNKNHIYQFLGNLMSCICTGYSDVFCVFLCHSKKRGHQTGHHRSPGFTQWKSCHRCKS